jgi:hypothetical protein
MHLTETGIGLESASLEKSMPVVVPAIRVLPVFANTVRPDQFWAYLIVTARSQHTYRYRPEIFMHYQTHSQTTLLYL